jgi:hypothetical protein
MKNVTKLSSPCLIIAAFLLLSITLVAQTNPPGLTSIKIEDLKSDLKNTEPSA